MKNYFVLLAYLVLSILVLLIRSRSSREEAVQSESKLLRSKSLNEIRRVKSGPTTVSPESKPEKSGLILSKGFFEEKKVEILSRPHGEERRKDLVDLAEKWAQSDQYAALDWAKSLSGLKDRSSVIDKIVEVAPDSLGMSIQVSNLSEEQRGAISRPVLSGLTFSLIDTVGTSGTLSWLSSSFSGEAFLTQKLNMFDHVLERDLDEALILLGELGDLGGRRSHNHTVYRSLERLRPEKAFYYLLDSEDLDKESLLRTLGKSWYRNDSELAWQHLGELTESSLKEAFASGLLKALVVSTPDDPLSSLSRIEGPLGVNLRNDAVDLWVSSYPKEALKYFKENFVFDEWPPELPNRMMNSLVGKGSFTEAVKLFEVVDDSGLARKLIGSLVDRWARNDIESAAAWLSQVPDGEVRDEGILKLLSHLNEEETKVEWERALTTHEE